MGTTWWKCVYQILFSFSLSGDMGWTINTYFLESLVFNVMSLPHLVGRITKIKLKEKKSDTLIHFPSKILPAFRALHFLLQEEKEVAICG